MSINKLEKTRKLALREICNGMRGLLPGYNELDMLSAAYLLLKASQMDRKDRTYKNILELSDTEVAYILNQYTKIDAVWENIKDIADKYDSEIFADILKYEAQLDNFRQSGDLPESLLNLGLAIFNMDGKSRFMQFCCGSAPCLTTIKQKYPNMKISGMDIDKCYIHMAVLRNQAFDGTLNIIGKSPIDFELGNIPKQKYIFSTHPFGLRTRTFSDKYLDIQVQYPYIKSGTAADWLFCSKMVDMLDNDGVGIAVMSTGCFFTNQDREARKYFIENGLIKAIIALPSKMYTSTGITTVMVVFTRENEKVHMVDASEMCKSGRRQNELTEANIMAILEACKSDTDKSITLTVKDFEKNDFDLNPTRYLSVQEDEIKNGVPLGEVVDFSRSVMLTAAQLDTLAVHEGETSDIYYLRLSEIHEGVVDKNLPMLREIDAKDERFLLQKDDIILSRNGSPFKVALFQPQGTEKVLPVGNLYVLRYKDGKINPIYLKAYLESAQGAASLSSILTGVAMQVISMDKLKKLIIPVPDMVEQEKIAEKYLTITDEIAVLNIKITNAKNRLIHVLDSLKAGEE